MIKDLEELRDFRLKDEDDSTLIDRVIKRIKFMEEEIKRLEEYEWMYNDLNK